MRATIYDVAKQAGVSIATVSKVVNQTGNISQTTRELVIEVMKELEYEPSSIASALTGKETGTIGLLVPDLANPFFAEVARKIEDEAQALGLGVVACSTDLDDEKVERYVSLLSQKRVDGLIVASIVTNSSILQKLVKQNIPLLLFSVDIPSLGVDTVSLDDYRAGYLATDHLLELGHQRIGTIIENAQSSNYRMQGYTEAFNVHGIAVPNEHTVQIKSTFEHGRKAANELLSQENPPSAIIAFNDLLAIAVLQEANRLGFHVPKDLSVVGFDNTMYAEISSPPLTTVAQPIDEMSSLTMQILSKRIKKESSHKQRIMLSPELIKRQSTAAPNSQRI
ncbi:LacI family DNA-binding transcriptional regulator [Salsuginibacillus kocurii]|uniref:LacI family DNA-binding transcriptional regulator n=1 Tax=Salsuginibacillus kocurii TaxID=427078 RepID=UPI0003607FBD|nr:LacI family DNA-binding transcriptional regulator [Salsuginibacillus kocurii]